MPVIALDAFLTNLVRSGLLTQQQLADLRADVEAAAARLSASDLAGRLVEKQWLTRWQAGRLLAGQTAFFLGKYKLLSELGRGGMGAVYKAEQCPLGRTVAVKVMARKLVSDEMAVARFHREIQAAAALTHPNVVTSLNADRVEDTHFLVMEYFDGESLDAILKQHERLPEPLACEYIRQAALGLQHAFEQGMAHRDIKPGNLLVTHTGDGQAAVKILDMGLARFTSESRDERELTTTGQVMGTPDYIAPEQARSTKTADIRSDIFSLGCTLFRALTGQMPFGGETVMEKLSARLLDEPIRLRSLLPEASAGLEALVSKMLARDPAARQQTPQEVAQALLPFASQPHAVRHRIPVPVPSPFGSEEFGASDDAGVNEFLNHLAHEAAIQERVETLVGARELPGETMSGAKAHSAAARAGRTTPLSSEQSRRRARRLRLLILAVTALTVVIGGSYWIWRETGKTVLIVDWPEAERAAARLEVDGRAVNVPRTGAIRLRGTPGRRRATIDRDGFEPVTGEWELSRGAEATFQPVWKPTATSVRREELEAVVREVDDLLKTPQSHSLRATDPPVRDLRTRIDALEQNHPTAELLGTTLSLQTRLPSPADSLRREGIDSYELSMAGGGDAAGAPPEVVAIFGNSRLRHWMDIDGAQEITGLDVSSDGRFIASSSADDTIRIWDGARGDELRVIPGLKKSFYSLARSPDGRFFAAAIYSGTITVWDSETGAMVADMPGNNGSHAFSPDSRLLATGSTEITLSKTDSWELDRKLASLPAETGQSESVVQVSFSSSGNSLASVHVGGVQRTRQRLALWDLNTNTLLRAFAIEDSASLVGFVPEREEEIAVTTNKEVRFYNASTAELQRTLTTDNHITACRFSGNGKFLVTGEQGGTINFWSIGDLSCVRSLASRFPDPYVQHLAVDAEAQTLAAAGDGPTIKVWHFSAAGAADHVRSKMPDVLDAVSLPSGQFGILEWLENQAQVRMWDTVSQEVVWTLQDAFVTRPTVACCDPASLLAVVIPDEQIALYDLATGKKGPSLPLSLGNLRRLVFSNNGLRIAAAYADKTVLVWETANGKLLRRLETAIGFYDGMGYLAFVPGDKELAALGYPASDRAIHLLPLSDKGKVRDIDNATTSGIWSLAFLPDGVTVFVGDDWGSIQMRRLDGRGRELVIHPKVESTRRANSLALSPDNRLLAGAIIDGSVRVWAIEKNYATEELHRQLTPGHGSARVSFTRDGRHLITANGNGTIYVLRLAKWSPEVETKD